MIYIQYRVSYKHYSCKDDFQIESRLWSHVQPSTFYMYYVVCCFFAVNITGDFENYVLISILLNKTKIVETERNSPFLR